MSWLGDRIVQEAFDELSPVGRFQPDPRLFLYPAGAWGATNSVARKAQRILLAATPAFPTTDEVTATAATYETVGVLTVYAQYSTHTSASFTGYTQVATVDAYDKPCTQFPPVIYFYFATGISIATTNSILTLVTKEGWLISGVSYPSASAQVRVVS
jgi:hypothetical protein